MAEGLRSRGNTDLLNDFFARIDETLQDHFDVMQKREDKWTQQTSFKYKTYHSGFHGDLPTFLQTSPPVLRTHNIDPLSR